MTNDFLMSTTIILAETCLVLLLISGYLIFAQIKKKKNNQQAVSKLKALIENNSQDNLDSLKTSLTESLNLDDETCAESASEILQNENELFKKIIEIYQGRENGNDSELNERLNDFKESFLKITSLSAAPSGDSSMSIEEKQNLVGKIENLLEHNRKLDDELEKTKLEMDSTVEEYAAAFARSQQGAKHNLTPPEPPQETPPSDDSENEPTEDIDIEALADALSDDDAEEKTDDSTTTAPETVNTTENPTEKEPPASNEDVEIEIDVEPSQAETSDISEEKPPEVAQKPSDTTDQANQKDSPAKDKKEENEIAGVELF